MDGFDFCPSNKQAKTLALNQCLNNIWIPRDSSTNSSTLHHTREVRLKPAESFMALRTLRKVSKFVRWFPNRFCSIPQVSFHFSRKKRYLLEFYHWSCNMIQFSKIVRSSHCVKRSYPKYNQKYVFQWLRRTESSLGFVWN